MPERVSPQQREADPFRWCVWCDADCQTADQEHADWCPQVTNVRPVTVEWYCRHCLRGFEDARIEPYCCAECETPFRWGDHYSHRWVASDVAEPVCLGCSARGSL